MINGKRIAVVLPAYNAEKTLEATVQEIPDLVDDIILVDDHSKDRTVKLAKQLGLRVFVHDRNYGYGRNQQTCYREALAAGADVVAIARGAGIVQSAWAADEGDFEELIDLSLHEDGPWLIGCRIDQSGPADTTERDPARIRDQFMRGLGVK